MIAFWVVLAVSAVLLYNVFTVKPDGVGTELNFSKFLEEVRNKNIRKVTVLNGDVTGELLSGGAFKTVIPSDYPELYDNLDGVDVRIERPTRSLWLAALISLAPFLVIVGFLLFFMRQTQGGGNKALSFGKSRARLMTANQKRVTFKDVAGVEEAREELQEIIEFLKEPQKFQRLGGRIPKGVLLVGPPGTG